ncbi:MAG: 5'/3'-nucleotidase SurE [Gemmatimonadota bacterium]
MSAPRPLEPASETREAARSLRDDEARVLFLVTNDDGIHAAGLDLLARVAARLGEVEVVAPDRQQSASSHSLTLHRPLRVTRAGDGRYVIDGTPTDCVLLAANRMLGFAPDFVLSGVNHGPNMGEDVLYSGTVAAAMEGTILGIPSVAISYAGKREEWLAGYTDLLTRLLRTLVARNQLPGETFFNINLPERPVGKVEGVRVTRLGRRVYSDSLTRRQDPSGREYFWIGGGVSSWSGGEDSDFRAVKAGYVSITPLHLDLTDYRLIEEVSSWTLEP